VRGGVRYGAKPGTDRLAMRLTLARLPRKLDPRRRGLEIRVSDDDDILAVTIPRRAFVRAGPGRWVLGRRVGPVRAATLLLDGRAELRLVTAPTDLARAERAPHLVTVAIRSGTYQASHTRLWDVRGGRLAPGGR
jgi:hypothetical protein